MMVATAEFVDCTGTNFNNVPLAAGEYRGVYVTGTDGIEETPAEFAAALAAGAPLITIDQQPGLPLFSAGKAAVADVESGAATVADAVAALAARRALGLTFHTFYISYDALAGLQQALGDLTGCWFWVADYSWSIAQAISLLNANSNWGACQFGDPESNPLTLVPGSGKDLQEADFDIDVGNTAWMQQAAGVSPAPPVPAPTAPPFPLPAGSYMGTPRPDPACYSGYYGNPGHAAVLAYQQRMADRGWVISVDGDYGINEAELNQGQTPDVTIAFQKMFGLEEDYLAGIETWNAAWEKPVTAA